VRSRRVGWPCGLPIHAATEVLSESARPEEEVRDTSGAPQSGQVPAASQTSQEIRWGKDITRSRHRASQVILLMIALALAGLGHYYLLYMHNYLCDALIFCAVSAGLFVLAWRRSGPTRGRRWALLLATLRRLVAVLCYPGRRGLHRVLLASVAGLNALAALVAATTPPPTGVVIVAALWVPTFWGGVVVPFWARLIRRL